MTDVTIDSSMNQAATATCRTRVTTLPGDLAYALFLDGNQIHSRKSSDAGQTFAARVTLYGQPNPRTWASYYDGWTPGSTKTQFHVLALQGDFPRDVWYNYIDLSDDSVGTELVVLTTDIGPGWGFDFYGASIVRARSGRLYMQFGARDTGFGFAHAFYKSDDDGATWSPLTSGMVGEADGYRDKFVLAPGNEADDDDIIMPYWDWSANEWTVKTYDASANTWSESAAFATGIGVAIFNGATDPTDNSFVFAYWSEFDTGTADLRVVRINSGASIEALTNVVTNSDDCSYVGVSVTAVGHYYVSYIGKSDGSETLGSSVGVYWRRSTNRGGSWSSETAIAESLGALQDVTVPVTGTRFLPVWTLNTGTANEDDLKTNYLLSFDFPGGGGGGSSGGKGGSKGGGPPGGNGPPGQGGGGGPGTKKDTLVASRRRLRLTAGVL